MNKTQIAKKITSTVASVSVGYTATQVILANTPPQTSKLRALETAIGTFVIASLVADVAEEYTEKQFDAFAKLWTRKSKETPAEA